jgi:glyoxylase-like metal-dependent hydrolase (beta-lactamase superfamily II)
MIMLTKEPPAQITDRLWMLGTSAFPLYLYQGDNNHGHTIFEGSISAMGPVLDQQLQNLGVANDQVRQVVVTHAHPDHVMAVPVFQRMFPHMTTIASKLAAQTLQIEKAVAFFGKLDGALTKWLAKRKLIDEQEQQLFDQKDPAKGPIKVDRIVGEGDRIDVGLDRAFTVLETPGHSDCSLSFYEPQDRVLVISDATGYFMPDQDFIWPGYFTSLADYLQSLERLANTGAEHLCLSHNAVIQGSDDVVAYFQRVIAETERYHKQIVDQVQAGTAVKAIAEELGNDVYERTGQLNPDFFHKNCALLVKNSLRHEGIEDGS